MNKNYANYESNTYNRNIYRPVQRKIIPIPKRDLYIRCIDDNHYRKLIRSQVRPFGGELALRLEETIKAKAKENLVTSTGGESPQPLLNSTKAGINTRKLIDFQASQLSEADKRFHCRVMVETLDKLAICYNTINHITEDALYWLYEAHNWQCAETGTHHVPYYKELTIEFKTAIYRGGRIVISNCKPVYRQGWYGGFYRLAGQPAQFELAA